MAFLYLYIFLLPTLLLLPSYTYGDQDLYACTHKEFSSPTLLTPSPIAKNMRNVRLRKTHLPKTITPSNVTVTVSGPNATIIDIDAPAQSESTKEIILPDPLPTIAPIEAIDPATENTKAAEPTISIENSKAEEKPLNLNVRPVQVTNRVNKKMRTYKHWGTSHEPTFTLRANGQIIKENESVPVDITDNILNMAYHADFYGMRTSQDTASFIVNKDAKHVDVTFSWDAKPRIIIDKAHPE